MNDFFASPTGVHNLRQSTLHRVCTCNLNPAFSSGGENWLLFCLIFHKPACCSLPPTRELSRTSHRPQRHPAPGAGDPRFGTKEQKTVLESSAHFPKCVFRDFPYHVIQDSLLFLHWPYKPIYSLKILCDIMACSLVVGHQRFWRTQCTHVHGNDHQTTKRYILILLNCTSKHVNLLHHQLVTEMSSTWDGKESSHTGVSVCRNVRTEGTTYSRGLCFPQSRRHFSIRPRMSLVCNV